MTSPANMYLIAVLVVTGGPALGQDFIQTCSTPQFPSGTKVGIDSRCGLTGSAKLKSPDAVQNQQKNSFCATGSAIPTSFADFQALQDSVEANKKINFGNPIGKNHPLSSKAGPTKDRKPLRALGEGQLRAVEGYIFTARSRAGVRELRPGVPERESERC